MIRRSAAVFIVGGIGLFAITTYAWAQAKLGSAPKLTDQILELRERVEKLEARVKELEKIPRAIPARPLRPEFLVPQNNQRRAPGSGNSMERSTTTLCDLD